ncbi:Hint domain-containing protein [Pseudosulfitobacter pseudonitzschiae]|uniref:Hint domain-containing protein n=1 Tax=Pseudosulfitobacter pseudonitzschiae TaxID=1402135 RepID=UPI001AF25DDD|nr:Hint domain-containing protein [Pseudosulfitobacter pseudonitzschiae]MBM1813746.1 Hint domain-containing protein [Pseudosulfitobacter pseudonitzschiae]MBM1830739.1 Hint domain-containing protein [Pseudosulfitobacter pseudonitzschiae]MBM1835606.1 Hint domain-containing protein [Pseudosulfitobacter pseudonitzschiae]MBM1840452.1 Hint domain-containing protein [Pseudosulfitobacter pseudonitzschiae]MBM1845560.1 Hint domain-containing protein [Pseudosulfitobacter pseudonitzschiae]
MPSYTFDAYGFDTITTTGPDPFDSNNTGNSDSVANGSTIRIDPSAVASDLVMIDNDSTFEDGDGQQELADPLTLNGTQFSPGTSVETEYAYVIRPVGSTDPGDNITIYVLEFDGDVVGIASDKRLIPGQEYKIVSIASNDPTIAYADMAVCFLRGTLIAVPDGERAVEDIQVGDLVTTVDDGPQEVVWCGRQKVSGQGNLAPIRIARGALGNNRDLFVSPQHRILVAADWLAGGQEHLVPAKALVGLPGIGISPRYVVHYHHIMCAAHHLVRANGAIAETMLPGPEALRVLGPVAQEEIASVAGPPESMPPARPCLRVGQWRRMLRHAERVSRIAPVVAHPVP